MPTGKQVSGRFIGQEDVLIQEIAVTEAGQRFRRLDVGVSGTLEGWVVKEGPRGNHFTSHPEFAFSQSGNEYRRYHGTLRYEASKGTSFTLIYPEGETKWNRKLFFTVHGRSGSFYGGSLKPWNQNLDSSDPTGDLNDLERMMLAKGYAVAKTRRNAGAARGDPGLGPGDYPVTLDDGEVVPGKNLNIHTGLLLDLVRLAENLIEQRLGARPRRTYWFGHSAGGMNGRLVNYVSGLNLDENGDAIIDGFLHSDSGGGRYLPVLMEDGRDVLLMTEEDRRQFAKTIEITHLLYVSRMNVPGLPAWMSDSFLINKRLSAKVLKDKALGKMARMYEVQGVSHLPGGLRSGTGDTVLLDLLPLMGGLVDLLDNWVERDTIPPPTRSDWLELGDADGDGMNENSSLALPGVACPLGLYFPFPPSRGLGGATLTGFAEFDGKSLEPEDGRGVHVDMNLNRYLDHRESVEQAWHRLGLLAVGETFNRSKYQECVEKTVSGLKKDGLIGEEAAIRYIQEASKTAFP